MAKQIIRHFIAIIYSQENYEPLRNLGIFQIRAPLQFQKDWHKIEPLNFSISASRELRVMGF